MRTCDLVLWLLAAAAVLVAAHPASAQLADSPWPSFQRDARNTALSPYRGPEEPVEKWIFEKPVSSAPVVGADGRIYVSAGGLRALNAAGRVQWTLEDGAAALAIDSTGRVYATRDDRLLAISPEGQVQWPLQTDGHIGSSPAIGPDGTVYVGSADSSLYAIGPSGNPKWSYRSDGRIQSEIAIGPAGNVYFGAESGNLHALSPEGQLKWLFATSPVMGNGPTVGSDGRVYWGEDGELVALSSDGDLEWRYVGEPTWQPAIGPRGSIYTVTTEGLSAFFLDGTREWTYEDRWLVQGVAIGADGTLFALSDTASMRYPEAEDSYLLAISSRGALQWKYNLGPGDIASPPVIAGEGLVLVGTSEGLHAIGDATTSSTPDRAGLPDAYALGPNYPNPFNPVTRIPYELPVAGQVRLEIYDLLGRRLKVIENDWKPAGRHVLRARAGNLPSGTYLYRLSANGTIRERAMTIVK